MSHKEPLPIARLMLLASLLLAVVGYLFLWVQAARTVPLVPAARVWMIAGGIFAGLFGILALLYLFSDVLLPEFPSLVQQGTDRVGIARFEIWGIAAAAVGTGICLLYAPAMAPLPVFGGLGFLLMLKVSSRPVPLEEARSLYRPPHLPPEQLQPAQPGEEREGEQPPEGIEVRKYEWYVEGTPQDLEVFILLERLQSFRNKNPYRREPPPKEVEFHVFVTEGLTGEVYQAAEHFQQETRRRTWTPFHEICNVLAFVQHIPYSFDEESMGQEDYFRYPIETLYDVTGDCEDTSILAASLLKVLGYEVVMLLIPPRQEESGHVAVGVAATEGFPLELRSRLASQRYLYCETTAEGWQVGEVPEDYLGREIEVRPV